jgi:hypothetical protein
MPPGIAAHEARTDLGGPGIQAYPPGREICIQQEVATKRLTDPRLLSFHMMTPQRMLQTFGVHPHKYPPAFTQNGFEPKWVKTNAYSIASLPSLARNPHIPVPSLAWYLAWMLVVTVTLIRFFTYSCNTVSYSE